eukprot:343359_1
MTELITFRRGLSAALFLFICFLLGGLELKGNLFGSLHHRIVAGSHVERLLRQVVHLAVAQLPERSKRVGQRHVQALLASELAGHMERLTEEALRFPGAFHRQFVGL